MSDINKTESIMSISIIDVKGKVNGGVSLLLNLMINDSSYEIAYWFNKIGDIRLVPEQVLLDKLEIETIYEYELIDDLIYFIHTNIPNMDKIIKEFL